MCGVLWRVILFFFVHLVFCVLCCSFPYPDMAPVKEELAKLKNSELIEELNSRGLDTSGKKSELVDRLWEAVRPEGQGKSSPEISEVKGEVGMGLSQDQVKSHDTSVVRSEATQMLAKLKALKEMQELEEQELRIRMRRQQMEIELKLADLPEPEVSREVLDSLKIQTNDNRVSTAKADATDLLNTQLQRILLPPTEVEKFDGNLVKYKLFIRSFRSRIESRTSDQDELLHYLEQLTVGKPKQIVRSCMFLGDQGYTEARRLLDQRYGSPHKVVDAYIQRLNDWCKIPPGDVEELDRLTLYLVEIKHAMTDLDIAGN